MSLESQEKLNVLLEKIKDIQQENIALKAEILTLKATGKNMQTIHKKEKRDQKKETRPSLF